jgi:exodeoxyribonuclease V gamma subunit
LLPNGKDGRAVALQVTTSSSLKTLARELAAELDRSRSDPFSAPLILVPSQPIRNWLTYELATLQGIAANLDFQFFEAGLWSIVRAMDPEKSRALPVERLNREPVQWMIVAALLAAEREGELAPLLNYTGVLNDLNDRFAVRKLWQLAERLSRLFREYEASDPRLVEEWLSAKPIPRGSTPMWRCQRALYRQIFSDGGLRDRVAEIQKELPLSTLEYARDVLNAEPDWSAVLSRGTIHLFGLPSAGSALLDVVERLSEHAPIRLYQWQVHPSENSAAGVLARKWNAANVQRSVWLSDADVRPAKEALVAPDSRLAAFQAAARGGDTAFSATAADRSIEVLSCPGIRREVEAVRDAVVHAMETTPDLKLSEIGILAHDMTAYRPHLEAVFQRDDIKVPFNLSDTTAEDDSVYAQAVEALLALAGVKFTRKDVFTLALNPCFLAAQELSREDVMVWLDWADRLNIFREYDAHERSESNPFTWRHALRRLRLGRVMSPRAERLGVYAGVVPFEGSEPEAVARFSAVIERLARFAERCTESQRTASAWVDLLTSNLEEFLRVPDDRGEEKNVRSELFKALEHFRSMDDILACAIEGKKNKAARTRLAFPVLRELVSSSIAEVPSRSGHFLLDGVTICALRAERPIPFRITFLLGMGEGVFPGQDVPLGLDVRDSADVARRLPTMGESGRLAFLESVMCARERIVFSYVGRNLQKDEAFHPSVLIRELEALGGVKIPRVEIPISAASERYLLTEESSAEQGAVPVAYRRHDFLRAIAALEGQLDERKEISATTKKQLRELFVFLNQARAGTQLEAVPAHADAGGTLSVTLRNLAEFLRDPLKEKLRRHLGLHDDDREDERALAEDEPFYSSDLDRGAMFKNALQIAVASRGEESVPAAAERALREGHADRQWTGDAPVGAFARLDRTRLQAAIRDTLARPVVVSKLESMASTRAVIVGRRSSAAEGETVFPPLELKIDGHALPVKLVGQQAHSYRSQPLGPREFLAITSTKNKESTPPVQILEAWLMYVCLSASTDANAKGQSGRTWLGDAGCRLWLLHGQGLKGWNYPPLSANEARAYLTELVADYLSDARYEHLPLQIVASTLTDEEIESSRIANAEGFVERIAEQLEQSAETDYGYSEPDLFRLLSNRIPADAARLAERRVMLFLKGESLKLEGGEA